MDVFFTIASDFTMPFSVIYITILPGYSGLLLKLCLFLGLSL
jgi:hypothetical protein